MDKHWTKRGDNTSAELKLKSELKMKLLSKVMIVAMTLKLYAFKVHAIDFQS